MPGGKVGAWLSAGLVLVSLAAAIVFFLVDPFALDAFDARTFWLIAGGLVVTFIVQEVFVRLAPRWKAAQGIPAAGPSVHPEAHADVELEGLAPEDASTLDATPAPAPDESRR